MSWDGNTAADETDPFLCACDELQGYAHREKPDNKYPIYDQCFYASTLEMENGYTCPYCNDRMPLKGFNTFGDKHPELIKEMDEIANYLLDYTEYDVLDTSNKKFWWICPKDPKHKYPMSPSTRLMFQKRRHEPCLYCRGQSRKLNHFVEYKPDK